MGGGNASHRNVAVRYAHGVKAMESASATLIEVRWRLCIYENKRLF